MRMGEIETGVSLVDFLAKEMGCMYVSDLTHLDERQQRRLAAVLDRLSGESASVREWDDALCYIEMLPPQNDAERDRKCLISALLRERRGKQRELTRKEQSK